MFFSEEDPAKAHKKEQEAEQAKEAKEVSLWVRFLVIFFFYREL